MNESSAPPERIWIGTTEHQIKQSYVRGGGHYAHEQDKHSPATDTEYVSADLVRSVSPDAGEVAKRIADAVMAAPPGAKLVDIISAELANVGTPDADDKEK